MVIIGHLSLNRSVVAAIGKDPVGSAKKAKELGADILELRVDLFAEQPHASAREIKKLGLPVIMTNRMKEEGGAWEGSEEERIRELISLLPFSDAVDIELCAKDRDIVIQKAKSDGKIVIISTHDFRKTPEKAIIEGIIHESFVAGADIAKLAVMPHSLKDILRLMDITLNAEGPVCIIAMGETGKHSRVILPVYGSVMTYGYVDIPTAPGQFRVDELKYLLKMI